MLCEIWKDIKGYEGLYQVSNLGRVKSLKVSKIKSERIRKSYQQSSGYISIVLCKNGKAVNHKVHRLVASAFIDNPNNLPEINHKDENKANNKVDNLEWCDSSYNKNYGTRTEKFIRSRGTPVKCIETR